MTSESSSSEDECLFPNESDEALHNHIGLDVMEHYEERMPRRTSILTGRMFIAEKLNGHPDDCHDMFRMQPHVFINFCETLKERGLRDGKKVSVEEGVAMFLFIIGHTIRYQVVAERFQHSLHTVHIWFKRVLRAVCSLATEIIRPSPQGGVHQHILNNTKYYPYFKDCIGAIDGTHIAAYAPAARQTAFRGRKQQITQNVMLACDFDMKFTFVYTGWEGAANDSRVFIDAVIRPENNFPMPRGDQFYLVDAGYPNMPGFLAPYRGRRYHLRDFRGQGRPRGKEELFNKRHSSCRNIIERSIGVLKARFPILKLISNYSLIRQRQIPIACCAVHNFIRQQHDLDRLFTDDSISNEDEHEPIQTDDVIQFNVSQTAAIGAVRETIATQMWNDYQHTHA